MVWWMLSWSQPVNNLWSSRLFVQKATWGPLHTWDWGPVTITLQALSLVEKGRPSPSSLHTTLEEPTEYVNARWMQSLHGLLHGIEWIMFHGHLDYFLKPPLRGRPNTKPRDCGTPNIHNRWFILFYHGLRTRMNEIHWNSMGLRAQSCMTSNNAWGPWPHHMILEVSWDGFWTLSFGLSQFHGHYSWLLVTSCIGREISNQQ